MANSAPTRRDLLRLAGMIGGTALAYRSMSALAAPPGPAVSGLRPGMLAGAGAREEVLVLGAGIAGLVAATELRGAGYTVKILEYDRRPGGRSWTIRGGDVIDELGGARQLCRFDEGLYFNPGPMRIPYDHSLFLQYCSINDVALESFAQGNGAAYFHSTTAFGGKPQRAREIQADFEGAVAELLAKSADAGALDDTVGKEDLEILRDALRDWGALDKNHRYAVGAASTGRRGAPFGPPGGGLTAPFGKSQPVALHDILTAGFWQHLATQHSADWAPTMFQPVGGMDRLVRALADKLGPAIQYGAKVTDIEQQDGRVIVRYADLAAGGAMRTTTADWCVCAIPASILGQLRVQVGNAMKAAIDSVWYASSVKVGLQFKRRFWEQDERIYGGMTFTNQSINQIVYPSSGFGSRGKGVLTGAFVAGLGGFQPGASYAMTAQPPEERIRWALREGARIHPQYAAEFDNGVSVAWHRNPGSLGCFAAWHGDDDRAKYEALCAIDGRIVLAGEHCSYLSGWQEGAIASALDAVGRLNKRIHTPA